MTIWLMPGSDTIREEAECPIKGAIQINRINLG